MFICVFWDRIGDENVVRGGCLCILMIKLERGFGVWVEVIWVFESEFRFREFKSFVRGYIFFF